MKIVFGALKEFNDDAMMMARAFGLDGVHFNTPPIASADEKHWSVSSLK